MRIHLPAAAAALAVTLTGCAILNDQAARPDAGAEPAVATRPPLPTPLLPQEEYLFRAPPALPDPLPPARRASLWDRIRDGFALPTTNARAVVEERNFYGSHPTYMNRVAERAKPYLHYIVERVEARGYPTELALLPIVESAFRPFAYSHGRAAGLWQFIPSTGRHFGLEQNWWYDGRRDVVAATDAALDYLGRLHEMFDGDWLLAVAAYNAGEGTVLRAMKRNARRNRGTDFWSLDLPDETERYVPRLLGLRDVVDNPSAYDLALVDIPNRERLSVVDTGSQIDLALAADMADISVERVYQLNPGFNRWATAPEGPHRLLLPIDAAATFRSALAQTPEQARMRWQRHRIRSGESLIAIASRYNTTPEVIREANGLRGNLIRAGDALIVPIAQRDADAYVLSASQRRAALRERDRDGHKRRHTVRRGDTFWELARRYDVGVRELAKWNGMSPRDPLRPGETLVVWTDEPAAGGLRGLGPGNRMQSVNYTVESGDSLYAIAQRFNVSVSDLRRWNNVDGYLQPGQKLRMQVDVTAQNE